MDKLLTVLFIILLFIFPVLLKQTPEISKPTVEEPAGVCSIDISVAGEDMPIPLEEYVIGVVAAEMPVTFHEEALKAQAIAARTYALRTTDNGQKQIAADVSAQVYLTENHEVRDPPVQGRRVEVTIYEPLDLCPHERQEARTPDHPSPEHDALGREHVDNADEPPREVRSTPASRPPRRRARQPAFSSVPPARAQKPAPPNSRRETARRRRTDLRRGRDRREDGRSRGARARAGAGRRPGRLRRFRSRRSDSRACRPPGPPPSGVRRAQRR